MSLRRYSAAIAAIAAVVVPVTAAANPVDNDGDATFYFYDNPGSPFLNFASGEEAYSHTPSGGPSYFQAFIEPDGETFFTGALMGFHDTDLAISSTIQVQLFISDVLGFIDCSGLSGTCDVDWEITAQLRFKNVGAGGITTNNCRTSSFVITVQGDWGSVDSNPLTFPALSGSGTGACNTWASSLNNFFDLGVSGATLSLYKFEGVEDATGLHLEGS
ncbi:MAG: hypothetical protein HOW73_48480 [Polyangiaceae bacterium]|nr:hypothetical protein [Polyangiaceae bacterium]